MKKIAALVLAIFAATSVQPVVFALRFLPQAIIAGDTEAVFRIGLESAPYILIVSALVIVVVGVPTFLVLRRFGRDTPGRVAASGAVLAALPMALLVWPRYDSDPGASFSSGGNWYGRYVDFVVDNKPTVYAWLAYAENIVFLGLHGLVAALVFRWVWHRITGEGVEPASADSGPSVGMAETTVYYNSACPVCRNGVSAQQTLMRGCEVNWVDVHREPDAVRMLGLSLDEVRERLVVREADGRIRVGSDAFATLWSRTPGLRWLGRVLMRGRLQRVAQRAYDAFARRLFRWNRAHGRW